MLAVAPYGATLIGTGGGITASPLWTQIIADALGEPIIASPHSQASSRGAALWVREKLGLGTLEEVAAGHEAEASGRRFEPDAARYAVYGEAQERQEELLTLVGDLL